MKISNLEIFIKKNDDLKNNYILNKPLKLLRINFKDYKNIENILKNNLII